MQPRETATPPLELIEEAAFRFELLGGRLNEAHTSNPTVLQLRPGQVALLDQVDEAIAGGTATWSRRRRRDLEKLLSARRWRSAILPPGFARCSRYPRSN
jgi:hypothetical protein